jgi:hypothetical protein
MTQVVDGSGVFDICALSPCCATAPYSLGASSAASAVHATDASCRQPAPPSVQTQLHTQLAPKAPPEWCRHPTPTAGSPPLSAHSPAVLLLLLHTHLAPKAPPAPCTHCGNASCPQPRGGGSLNAACMGDPPTCCAAAPHPLGAKSAASTVHVHNASCRQPSPLHTHLCAAAASCEVHIHLAPKAPPGQCMRSTPAASRPTPQCTLTCCAAAALHSLGAGRTVNVHDTSCPSPPSPSMDTHLLCSCCFTFTWRQKRRQDSACARRQLPPACPSWAPCLRQQSQNWRQCYSQSWYL